MLHQERHGQLADAIRAGVRDMGSTPETTTVDDLAAVDEFHIGGRTASVDLLHILLGDTAAIKVRNMVANVTAGRVSPVEMVARKR